MTKQRSFMPEFKRKTASLVLDQDYSHGVATSPTSGRKAAGIT